MAFNPFHRFRKHQKAFFAVLTIVCMIVFVFSFGQGDLFQTALGWFGATRQQGQKVATLYKKDIYESDLERVRERRQAANRFMLGTVGAKIEDAVGELERQVDKAEFAKIPLQVRSVLAERKNPMMNRDPDQAQRQLASLRQAFQDENVLKDPEQVRMVETLAGVLSFEAWYADALRGRADGLYFGGSDKPEGLLDFLVWKHQADRLGIFLTEDDLRKEINRAAMNRPALQGKTFVEDNWVRNFLHNPRSGAPSLSPAQLLEALTDEYRVALAQEALLGVAPGVRGYREVAGVDPETPAVPTPDEFLNYYREQRTTMKVALLPVGVEPIARGLKAEPTDKELRNRYEKYKDQEPVPNRREPGFKEPRRIKVEYFALNPEAPYFKKEAGKLAGALSIYSDRPKSAALRVLGLANAYAAGAPAVGWAAQVIQPFAVDPLGQQYETYRSDVQSNLLDRGIGVGFDLQDKGALPLATFGQVLGAGFARTGPLGVPVAASGTVKLFERTAAQTLAGRVLAGAHRSPLLALGAAVPTAHLEMTFEQAKPLLVQKLETDLSSQVLRDKVAEIKQKLSKVKSSPQEARKVVEQMAREYGLTLHAMKRPRSRYTIARDPELKDLKKGVEEMLTFIGSFLRSQGRTAPAYTDVLFATTPRDFPAGGTGLYDAQETQTGKETLVWWRSEEHPARTPTSFSAVKKEVEMAWRVEKARPLARDEAGRIAADIKKRNWPTDSDTRKAEILSALDGHARKGSKAFVLDNVAQLVSPPQPLQGTTHVYQPYRIPEDKEDLLPYPPKDFVKELLTLKKPGDATVIKDQPVNHFYVAVLLDRDVPTLDEFRRTYEHATDTDPLWQQYLMPEARSDFHRRVLEELRRESGAALDEDGKFVIPEGVKLRGAENRDAGE